MFVGLEKAYDRVPREEVWNSMRESGVAENERSILGSFRFDDGKQRRTVSFRRKIILCMRVADFPPKITILFAYRRESKSPY